MITRTLIEAENLSNGNVLEGRILHALPTHAYDLNYLYWGTCTLCFQVSHIFHTPLIF